ncbi:MAG: gliding motility-associated C-terminal domain-containing protein [Bacteroidetes bacterium]|nr:gliding motility-associated C-terminal domain-containing protein [Bacteroidota bacterium]
MLYTTISANASSTPSVLISWNNGTSTVTTNPLPITASGSYTAIATNSLGCTSQSVISVSSNTVANVNINASSTLITCATGSETLTANSSVGGPYVYSWTPSSTTFTGTSFPVTSPDNYTVVALNTANGCTATATQAISMQSINASFVADTYQGLMPLPVTFTNTSIFGFNPVGTTYSWSFGDGNSLNSNDTVVNHLYNTQGNFPVILTATNGFCKDTAMRYIKVDIISLFEVPNVFTPNGDGKNDVFTFNAVNMGQITITIFDRWGLKMFESTDTGNIRWDGKNKSGKTVTDGTYFYILTATGLDGVQYDKQGTISVFQ